jgi:CheY-like chemotaxis protein/anti-sigma regulatory factor (Ser/Thr protein kinase)
VQQVIDLTRARWSDQPQRRGIMIELNAALAPDLPDILGAENEIRDALTNLIFNAVDAMPEGGVIKVRTTLSSDPAAGGNPAQHLLLEVADTGTGMDEETRRRCLEPFFTTKGERGTGLGLGMVYGMAQRHGAALQIDSTPGAGTTMRLLFPVVSTASSASVTARVRALRVPARSLRILLVDDNPVLTESLRMTLEQEGHRATAAGGGQAGIDAFRSAWQTAEAFDVVITDLGMPFVDGRQVAESVRATSPHTPIILLTGWGPGQLPHSDSEPMPQVDRVLGKPPRMSELRTALAELTATDHRKSG